MDSAVLPKRNERLGTNRKTEEKDPNTILLATGLKEARKNININKRPVPSALTRVKSWLQLQTYEQCSSPELGTTTLLEPFRDEGKQRQKED
ncbi:hypothetical protein NDU88_001266 [Pleurodeles waltl]|uniref:Uncharacterized protein n=1 Tax=Pleurodeles waltl TaxID=8319 RepID=A0AAV7VZK2_PLEWA|nr:hypothetical protein NDU88_001266 [Pleurodeles waltl]